MLLEILVKVTNSLLSENNLDQKYHPQSVGTAAEGSYPNLL